MWWRCKEDEKAPRPLAPFVGSGATPLAAFRALLEESDHAGSQRCPAQAETARHNGHLGLGCGSGGTILGWDRPAVSGSAVPPEKDEPRRSRSPFEAAGRFRPAPAPLLARQPQEKPLPAVPQAGVLPWLYLRLRFLVFLAALALRGVFFFGITPTFSEMALAWVKRSR